MIEARPDWVLSRQRAWGVPLTCFVKTRRQAHGRGLPPARPRGERPHRRGLRGRGRRLPGTREGAKARFLGNDRRPRRLRAGLRHPRRLVRLRLHPRLRPARPRGRQPRTASPTSTWRAPTSTAAGSTPRCCRPAGPSAARPTGRPDPRLHARREGHEDVQVARATPWPRDKVVEEYGADILRLWVAQSDYTADLRIGPEILKGTADSYRRLRNTMRFLLGSLADLHRRATTSSPRRCPSWSAGCCTASPSWTEVVRERLRRLRLPGRVPGGVRLRHRWTSRPSTSTSARTRSTATATRPAAAPRGPCSATSSTA